MNHYTYELKDCLYLNITNRCNNSCAFCIKYQNRIFEGKYNLWLDKEPAPEEIIKEIPDPKKYSQIVFCGYGEPLIRLDAVIKIAKYLKINGAYVRINTDGLANLFHGRNILPDLAGVVDEIDISLNTQDSATYHKLCRSVYGERAHQVIIDFARSAKEVIPKIVLTIVDMPTVDKEKCAEIASALGVEFKVRSYYRTNYIA